MAKTKAPQDVGAAVLKKLGRIEDLLTELIIVQTCAADANRRKVARLLGVDNGRVAKVSNALKKKAEG